MEIQELKKYLKDHKITYDELAKMTGLSVSAITKIFGGFAKYPRIDTMQRIEKALGLSSQPLQWSAADQASGVTDNAQMTVTSAEMELVEIYRDIGRTQGEKAQRLVIKFAEMIFNNKD